MKAASLPHSFVLADFFQIESMALEVPDHVLEDEPGLELVLCPDCNGKGWLECYGSAWSGSCTAWHRPDLDFTLKPCSRCHTEGEVLAVITPAPEARVAVACERCGDSGWIDAEPTAKTRAAGFVYLLGQGICPCGAWRCGLDRAA